MPRWSAALASARVACVHAALFGAIWLGAALLYAIVIPGPAGPQPLWIAIDLAVIAGALALVRARSDELGLRSLGAQRAAKLAVLVGVAAACVLLAQLLIRDSNMVSLDEGEYLKTLRAHEIVRYGVYPYNMRWLAPMLAGAWNILPVDDAAALKALNFGGLVIASVGLSLFVIRLGVRYRLALAMPVFLLSSYLGVYAGINRLVLDPFAYGMFAILAHLALRREHWRWFAVFMLLTATTSEKAVFFIPVIAFGVLLARKPRWRLGPLVRAAGEIALYTAPTVVYLVLLRIYLLKSGLETNQCVQNLHLMSLSSLDINITNELVKPNSFQTLWFPFGAFSVYALLGFIAAPRWVKAFVLLLPPVYTSNLIACDARRIIAYAFIVYLPFGFLYLERMRREVPARLAWTFLGLLIGLALAEHYLLPLLDTLDVLTPKMWRAIRNVKLVTSAAELVIVGTLLFVHFTFYAGEPDAS